MTQNLLMLSMYNVSTCSTLDVLLLCLWWLKASLKPYSIPHIRLGKAPLMNTSGMLEWCLVFCFVIPRHSKWISLRSVYLFGAVRDKKNKRAGNQRGYRSLNEVKSCIQ